MNDNQAIEILSAPELNALVTAQANLKIAQLQLQVEELKHRNLILELKAKHGLNEADTVDITTGVISRTGASK